MDGNLSSNDGDVITRWCVDGHGLIMRSIWHVGPLLRDGTLVHVLADIPTPSADIHALYLATAHVPRRIRELVNHLAAGLNDRIDTYTDTTSNSNAQTATQTGHEGEGSLMADVVRTVLTKLRQVRRLVVRAELTLTALQATFWIALIVVSADAVLLLRRRAQRSRGSLTTLPPGGPLLCWRKMQP